MWLNHSHLLGHASNGHMCRWITHFPVYLLFLRWIPRQPAQALIRRLSLPVGYRGTTEISGEDEVTGQASLKHRRRKNLPEINASALSSPGCNSATSADEDENEKNSAQVFKSFSAGKLWADYKWRLPLWLHLWVPTQFLWDPWNQTQATGHDFWPWEQSPQVDWQCRWRLAEQEAHPY